MTPNPGETGSQAPRALVPEVSALLRCSDRAVLRLIGSGDLVASKGAGKWLVDTDSITAYLDKTSNRPRRRQRYGPISNRPVLGRRW